MSETESAVAEPLPDEPDALDAPLPDEKEAPPEEAPEEETAEEAVEEPSEDEEPGEDAAEDVKPKKRRSAQKRISELTRARHEAEREAQQLRQQLEALQANATPAAEPKQEDFQSYDEFVVAKAEWRAEQAVTKKLETLGKSLQESQQKSEQTARAASWEVKVEDARDKYDDFDDVVMHPDNPVSEAMAYAMAEEENGADVAYHLGSNPKLAREIASLSPTQAVLRIGKLSAKLAEGPKPKPTSTPNPVKALKASATPKKAPADMSYAEYKKWRLKE